MILLFVLIDRSAAAIAPEDSKPNRLTVTKLFTCFAHRSRATAQPGTVNGIARRICGHYPGVFPPGEGEASELAAHRSPKLSLFDSLCATFALPTVGGGRPVRNPKAFVRITDPEGLSWVVAGPLDKGIFTAVNFRNWLAAYGVR